MRPSHLSMILDGCQKPIFSTHSLRCSRSRSRSHPPSPKTASMPRPGYYILLPIAGPSAQPPFRHEGMPNSRPPANTTNNTTNLADNRSPSTTTPQGNKA